MKDIISFYIIFSIILIPYTLVIFNIDVINHINIINTNSDNIEVIGVNA